MRNLLIILLVNICLTNIQGQNIGVDTLFNKYVSKDTTQVALVVLQEGRVVFEKNYGGKQSNHLEMLYLGESAKTITAILVNKLANDGKFKLDDKVSEFVKLPSCMTSIRILDLLQHSSGINLPDKESLTTLSYLDVNEFYSGFIYKQTELIFSPGTKFSYNQMDYFLLAKLVESVSGLEYAKFVGKELFDKLGIDAYYILPNKIKKRKLPSSGNMVAGGVLTASDYSSVLYIKGVSDVWITVDGLKKLELEIFERKVFGEDFMKNIYACNAKTKVKYCGAGFQDVNNWIPYFYSGGISNGWSSCVVRMPYKKTSVYLFYNQGEVFGMRKDVFRILNAISTHKFLVK